MAVYYLSYMVVIVFADNKLYAKKFVKKFSSRKALMRTIDAIETVVPPIKYKAVKILNVKSWTTKTTYVSDENGVDPKYTETSNVPIELSAYCRRCGRLLTHPTSVGRKIGPECIKKVM